MLNSIYSKKEVLDKKFPKPEISDTVDKPQFLDNPNYQGNFIDTDYDNYKMNNKSINTERISNNTQMLDSGGNLLSTAGSSLGSATGSSTLSGVSSVAGSALGFTSDILARENSEPLNNKQSQANALKLAGSGASLGASVGSLVGPLGTVIGAAAGAIIGGGYGLIKGGSDAKKITRREQREQKAYLAKKIRDREEEQRIADGEAEIGRLKSIYQSQIGINS